MPLLVDILTGQLYKFKTALGSDVIAGTSPTLIATPQAIKDAGLLNPVVSIAIPVNGQISTGSSTVQPGTQFCLLPDVGSALIPFNTSNIFSARLYALVKADSGATGEASLVDGASSAVVTGSTISFSNTAYQILKSSTFSLSANTYFTYGLRRPSGGLLTNAYIKAALLILK